MEVRTTKALRPARVFVFAAALACSGGESASTGATTSTMTSTAGTTGTTGTTGEIATEGTSTGATDGQSGSTAASTGEDTTGALCGNGHIDGDELCDDGNVVDGDGCNADCTPSGAELWRQTIPGSGSVGINGMELDAAGDVVVAGFVGAVSAENAGWLAKFTVDGELLWEHIQPAPEGSNTGYRDVAVADDGRIVAVGWEEGDLVDSTIHVYAGDGSWQSGATIAVDPDNDLFSDVALAGELAVVMSRYGEEGAMKVIAYDAALAAAWEYVPAIEARGGALARGPDGATIAAFGEWTSPETQGLYVVSLSDDGDAVWSRSHGDPLTRYFPYRLAVDDGGDAVICGELARTEASDTLLFAVAGDDGAARWKERFPVPGPGYDWCSAVTFTDDGAVAFAGSAFTQSGGWDAWVGKADAATGEERWLRSFGGEGTATDRSAALVGLAGGELLVGGVMDDGQERLRTLLRLSP
ncbi:MAG: hypothetical protein KC486_04910 [Myxococcales bacterium]|nr:hypothetical protein [Myxococcales bacterium]